MTTNNNNLANKLAEKKQENKPMSLKDYINGYTTQLNKILVSPKETERFKRLLLNAMLENPKLNDCEPASFIKCMLNIAHLGLEPNSLSGQAYLIPFKIKDKMNCQLQIGYKGLLALAHKSGNIKMIYANAVKEGDLFDYDLGLNPTLTHKPAIQGRGESIFYYAVYKLVNGGEGFEVWSKDDILKHRELYSRKDKYGKFSSAWINNFDEMAKKTVLKALLKYAPIGSKLAEAVTIDETSKISNEIEIDNNNELILDLSNSSEEIIEEGEIKNE